MKLPLILALDTDRGSHPCGAVNCCRHHTSTLNMRTRARVRHQSHGAMEGIAHLRYTKQPISLVSGQEVAFMAVCWYHGREYRYEVYTGTRDPWGTSSIRVPTTLKIRMPWIWEISALGFYSKSAGDHPPPGTSIRSASEFALMHRRSIFRAGSLQADLTGRNSRPTIDSPSLSLLKWSDHTFIFNRPTSASSTITSE